VSYYDQIINLPWTKIQYFVGCAFPR